MYTVNYRRVERVADVLGRVGVEGVLLLEEKVDPQYAYVAKVAEELGPGRAAVAALLVALASYRLAMRAEEWWKCFSIMVPSLSGPGVDGVYRGVIRFLEECQGSVIGREGKIKRVSRAWAGARRMLEQLASQPRLVVEQPRKVAEALRIALGEKGYTKTVTFAVKMAYYAVRPLVGRVPLARGIPIPVDVRVACSSFSSMMVDGPGYRGLVSNPDPARRAWGRVADLTGIPELHLDTVAWLAGWAPRDLDLEEARIAVYSTLSPVIGEDLARSLAMELCRRKCS